MTPKSNRYDLTGSVFGRLTVIEKDGKRLDSQGYSRGPTYRCLCSCGNVKEKVYSGNLHAGKTRSCGCLSTEHRSSDKNLALLAQGRRRSKTGETSAFNRVLDIYIRSATKRNISWSLTLHEFKALIEGDCFYCNKSPFLLKVTAGSELLWNGIDRIDSSGDYVVDNCVSCCSRCNHGKWTDTMEEFTEWIKVVYKEMSIKGVI